MEETYFDVDNVIIETTRRCNMTCEHCLRGEPQQKDMKEEYIDKLFHQIDYISCITFSGGEPSLAPGIINYALESAKQHKAEVGNFYIVTNGKHVTEEFVIVCLKWYAYCTENECSQVQVSTDDYHESVSDNKLSLLKGLSFFSKRSNLVHKDVMPQGRAKGWGNGRKITKESITVDKWVTPLWENRLKITEGDIYLNCNGDLIAGCDWSYTSQNRNRICKVGELSLDALEDFGATIETEREE